MSTGIEINRKESCKKEIQSLSPKFRRFKLLLSIYDFSGLRLIGEKLIPQNANKQPTHFKRPPSSFIIWFLSLYVAVFSLGSARYQKYVDRIENRVNAILVLMASEDSRRDAFQLVADAQNMRTPVDPEIFNPLSVVESLFAPAEQLHPESIAVLKSAVSSFLGTHDLVILEGVDLAETDIRNCTLINANFRRANMNNITMFSVNLREANLVECTMKNATLYHTDFTNSNMRGADLSNSYISDGNLHRVVLQKSNLKCIEANKTSFTHGMIIDSNLENAYLADSNFNNSYFVRSKCGGAIFMGSQLKEVKFDGADFKNADFHAANLQRSRLHNTDITGACFRDADLRGVTAGINSKPEELVELLGTSLTLFGAKLDLNVEAPLRAQHPELFDEDEMYKRLRDDG